jgi:cysteinyl-tRNA synthetase
MAEFFVLLREVNAMLDRGEVTQGDVATVERFVAHADRVVGCLRPWEAEPAAVHGEVLELVERRQRARAERQWAEADRLRDEIARLGFVVEDTPQGPQVKRR